MAVPPMTVTKMRNDLKKRIAIATKAAMESERIITELEAVVCHLSPARLQIRAALTCIYQADMEYVRRLGVALDYLK